MKKFLLALAAGAALTIGLVGHAAPAIAGPPEQGEEACPPIPVVQIPWVDADGEDGVLPRLGGCPIP
jgi:hypothetical protein